MSKSGIRTLVVGLVAFAAIVGLFAPQADASNMGFKKTFSYTRNTPTTNEHWISLPYFYDPRGQMGGSNACNTGYVDAEDVLFDLNTDAGNANVTTIFSKNLTSGTLDQYSPGDYCSLSFALDKGRGVQITINPSGASPVTMTVVGSHDNAAAIPFTVGGNPSNEFWISVPYHFKRPGADTCGNPNLNASDVINSFPASRVATVFRKNETSGTLDQWSPADYCSLAFDLVIGQGLQVALTGAPGGITWSPSHF